MPEPIIREDLALKPVARAPSQPPKSLVRHATTLITIKNHHCLPIPSNVTFRPILTKNTGTKIE
ncbi:hypothetical protein D3C73_1603790 [compost metagenome]